MAVRRTVQVLFHKLEVGLIVDNSGVFIGTNQAHMWSSHNKTNNGFGSLEGEARGCVNLVMDNDLIDAPVDDRDSMLIYDAGKESTQQSIRFEEVHAGVLEANSSISIGDNRQQGWSAHAKANSGQGQAHTIHSKQNINYVHDNDVIDSPVDNQSREARPLNR